MTRMAARDPARGERIKYVRTELLNLRSQEAFAQWVGGVTRGAVGNWERGLDIGLDNMIAIAKKADVPLEWLAHDKGEKPEKGQKRSIPTDDLLQSAIASFEQLSDHDRKIFLQRVLGL
jgi:hypothetical protein